MLLSKLKTYDLPQWVFKWIKDFLTGRKKQRLKLNQSSYSDWANISAGAPQGTKLGPWLLIMINDLKINNSNIWKFVDDTTLDEIVKKNEESRIQTLIDDLTRQISEDQFKLNAKCRELQIGFCKPRAIFDPITVNAEVLEVVDSAKILGLNVSNNLKWNNHKDQIISKARNIFIFFLNLRERKLARKNWSYSIQRA